MSEPNNHPATASAEQLIADCEVRRLRRSGPGGQHRNKVETAISLHHLPTGVHAEASERRSQAQNYSLALFRLRVNLALEVRRSCDMDYAPSAVWQSRCGGGALKLSAAHGDFPTLLAEALDVLAALEYEPKSAGAVLRCTPSQLIRLLKLDPRALALVNRWRRGRQMHALR
ncbi:MAG: peptide chain release factor family protein [Thermoguttaceae bacterium]